MSNDEFEFLTGQPGNNHKSSADNEFDRTDMVHISSNIPPSYNDVGLASSGPSKSDFFKRPNDKQHSLWVHCLCVVTFDIEFGQCVESIYPENALNEQERLALSYSSFPDSNSCINDEAQYYFRTKVSSPNCSMSSSFEKFNASSPPAIHVDKDVAYGFVYFLQKRDRTAKRGYFQKSLLIISRLPFVKLFNHFVTEIGIKFFSESQTDDDIITLENIYHEFNQWPPLVTGTPLILSILNTSVSFYIPSREDKLINFQPRPKNKSPGPKFAHPMPLVPPSTCLTAYDMNLYSCFESVISDLQLLWEMVLTCEPLIIMAPTPKMCSEFVQGLVSLIWPYKCYDYRPCEYIPPQSKLN
ncbi:Protein DENND6B [Fragariocoptes setiger]|uniref:Protein DENND6B n=1 Tax=Fragariocoptes setiger TaxID=1670756 RepID=A0ABQ7SAV9_9ACAR|nr:Protein DENND6B [Fragariocoptes setiger]